MKLPARAAAALALALAATVVAPGALAKEPTAAQIDGPGLSSPITIGWNTSDGSAPVIPNYGNRSAEAKVMALAEHGGFFAAVFGHRSPDPMLKTQPAGTLGPRYRIVFGLPGPGGGSQIVQDVYPYAIPAPVTYLKPGQPFWDGQQTYGGWFVGSAELRRALIAAGLPKTAPGSTDGWSWPVTTLVSVGAALLLAAILLLLRRRLRPLQRQTAQMVDR